jgi:hypothetical protein
MSILESSLGRGLGAWKFATVIIKFCPSPQKSFNLHAHLFILKLESLPKSSQFPSTNSYLSYTTPI